MKSLYPTTLYTLKQVREFDQIAARLLGIDSFELMRRAGQAAFNVLYKQWSEVINQRAIKVFCGGGNNGGDGYIIAGLAQEQGLSVSVIALKDPSTLVGDTQKAWLFCRERGVDIAVFDQHSQINDHLVVDAMLGTGLLGEVQGNYRIAIKLINASKAPILAIDIPSGLCADTGAEMGIATKASHSITFIAIKQGLLTGMGPDCCGKLHFADLDVPQTVYKQHAATCHQLSENRFSGLIKKRPAHAHKGLYGHLLIVGGNHGMPGAIMMAAESAMACGIGCISVATRYEHLNALAVRQPEVMAKGINNADDFQTMISGKTAIVIGPGLGQDDWAQVLLKRALSASCPIVLDADALNILANNNTLLHNRKYPVILTPHPGEAARLLGTDTKTIQNSRFNAVNTIRKAIGAVTVLKGVGTLIASKKGVEICAAGNPAMATAGMGDILSGVIGSLLGQSINADDAASLGVWLHACAADDLAAEQGEIGLLATALIPYIRNRINRLVIQR